MDQYNFLLSKFRGGFLTSLVAALVFVTACASQPTKEQAVQTTEKVDPDRYLVVDCLLPGQVKQLGSKLTYLTPRRPVKTSAVNCEIRGGEYVSYDRANYATALKIWLPKAQEGDPNAQTYVGEIYEKGLGIQADYQIALNWYRKAAEQGNSRAQINLGYLYESGLGVERDLTQAMNWYRRASGFNDGELEFVSSIEKAQRVAAKAESVELKQEVGALKEQLADTRNELNQRRGALAASQSKVASLRAELKERRQLLQQTGAAQATIGSSSEVDAKKAAKLERELQVARDEQQRLAERLAKQQLQTGKLRVQLGDTQAKLLDQEELLLRDKEKLSDANSKLASLQSQAQTNSNQHTEEISRLRNEVAQYQRKVRDSEAAIAQLSARGDDSQKEMRALLSKEQSEQERLEQQLAKAQQEQTRLQSRLASTQLKQAGSDRKVVELEREIAQSESKLRKQESEISALQSELTQQQAKSTAVQTNRVVAAVEIGPSIEIIEPPLQLTRGEASAFLPASMNSVDIIGRVSSSKDLLTFHVNGKKYDLDSNGLFQISQPISGESQPVSVVAVDKNGKRNALNFVLVPKTPKDKGVSSAGSTAATTPRVDVNFGRYYALIIGNNEYKNLTSLRTAANDATEIDRILRTKYGFETKLLLNATRYDILSSLNEMRDKLTEDDNLLIYYAGHGELDRVNLRGYWLPTDAEPDSNTNWISNVAVTDVLNAMSAKHVLVVADSCYSGALTRSSVARLQSGMTETKRQKWYQAMSKARARSVLTSGGVKPVLDAGGGDHSLFAKAFIDTLQQNDIILEGFRLFREVQKRMKPVTARLNVEQNPQYSPIKYAGHEAGEFFLLPRNTGSANLRQSPNIMLALK